MRPNFAWRIIRLEFWGSRHFLVVGSGRDVGEMPPIDVSGNRDDNAEDSNGFKERGYP